MHNSSKHLSKNLSNNKNNLLNLDKIADFIALRKQQKQLLNPNLTQAKNAINHKNPNNQSGLENFDENKPTESIHRLSDLRTIQQLFGLLDNALANGDTILTLHSQHAEHDEKKHDEKKLQNWQNDGWLTQLTQLTHTPSPINTPIVAYRQANQWVFWLQRQWFAEYQLAMQLLAMTKRQAQLTNETKTQKTKTQKIKPLDLTDTDSSPVKTPNALQQQAIDKASRYAFSIITGGPGTGKTFTVAELVKRLQHTHSQPLSIALTAPTGKAAQRMQESLQNSLKGEKINLENAKTLHRLLGIGQHGTPRYHKNNHLPDDLVIVDEASMLGLELASQLVDAIKPTGRLILLGDANQLSAVDAGSVLADLCKIPALQTFRTELSETQRFDDNSKVGKLAKPIQYALNHAKPCNIDNLLEITNTLQVTNPEKIALLQADTFKQPDTLYQVLSQPYQPFFDLLNHWQKTTNMDSVNIDTDEFDTNCKKLFATFNQYRILTAGNHGILGKQMLNEQLKKIFLQKTGLVNHNYYFYHGLPIMINTNDYHLGLFNGDIGICLWIKESLMVCFADKLVAINQLSPSVCEPAYAMTIHKSQGSEFDCVAVCVGKSHQRLLSQELIYTAVTRSKQDVILVSEQQSLTASLQQKSHRHTGLALQF
ncbi:exodeoxyribonuclease V subunit alpha [Moraxella macacae 0408225]|uniref:RecBCD enzyme subunit RecD n=1 Tax=Moraxella macacae 0408225 TaxID=1230338 RepID=L2F694_9GAMM|nr:exodeoxyribonuclease V subunit alpha [Moraxella macacae]ELA08316.1 exodeoxyribonuclease V subunit alpha [Moraxella macacae 0408225]